MVGVPGRSRACKQCKQKRVACDIGQPQCARCVKAKRTCDYAKGHIFVLNVEGSHKTEYRKECGATFGSTSCPDVEQPPGRSVHQSKALSGSAFNPFSYYNAPTPGKVIRQALLASGISYGEHHISSTYFGIISSSLTQSIDTALYAPALACYILWRGREDGNASMIDASQQIYVHGLVSTQRALADVKLARSVATLAACHALGLYEALECPDKNATAYHWHRAACCELVRLRGAKAHREGLAHELFVNIRIFAVLEAIERGKPTYLCDEEWMTVPFETTPRTLFDRVIDICTLSPAIVTKAHSLKCAPPDQILSGITGIVSDIAAMISRFDAFYAEFVQSNHDVQLFWEQTEPEGGHVLGDDGESSVLNFTPTLWFPNLDTASILFMYWSSQVSLWVGLSDLSNLASQFSATEVFYSIVRSQLGQDMELSLEAMEARWLDMARKVCGSVTYCTSPSALENGPPRIATALNMMVETLKNRKVCEAEWAWAVRARNEMARRWIKLMVCF